MQSTSPSTYLNRGLFADTMLDKYFHLAPNKVVSDIGAGFGHMASKIESIGGTWQPFDYYKKMDQSIIWDLNHSYPKETSKAGTVIFLEVLEHLANPLLGIGHLAEHMEQGGYLILTTPNPQTSQSRINLLLKGVLYAFQPKHLKEHHVFTPWEHIVRFFLEQHGLEVIEYAIVDIQYQREKKQGIKAKLLSMVCNYIEKRDPKAAGMSYGMVARKK
jgi:2-polyprenyl-3-methyl-5-hydroxy-6-metoxy-1,4-benzoquinol methylase